MNGHVSIFSTTSQLFGQFLCPALGDRNYCDQSLESYYPLSHTFGYTWSKNYWTGRKKSLVFLKANFFDNEKFKFRHIQVLPK
jgi:hypothetical protein